MMTTCSRDRVCPSTRLSSPCSLAATASDASHCLAPPFRDDFGPESDVDLLVEFQPGHAPGLLHLAQMELELEDTLGRQVELRTSEDLSPYFRHEVTSTARQLYAA
jgi:predicted nucleotidyltransferase